VVFDALGKYQRSFISESHQAATEGKREHGKAERRERDKEAPAKRTQKGTGGGDGQP